MTIYISTDVETTGMCPPMHSMIQLGSVALNGDGESLGQEFTANLLPLPEEMPLQSTMDWWSKRPDIYAQVTKDQEPPETVMVRYIEWLKQFPQNELVFVGYPVTFDYAFVWYYLWRFTGGCPFPHGALDMKTLAMTLLGKEYRESHKRNWPTGWFPLAGTHAHVALDDAREQGHEFKQMLALMRSRQRLLQIES